MIKIKDSKKVRNNIFILLCIICFMLGFMSVQGFVFYSYKQEKNRLVSLRKDYKMLCSEIDDYKLLKSQYELVLNESNDLNSNKEMLEKKIDALNADIRNLETKITDINKKIKNLS